MPETRSLGARDNSQSADFAPSVGRRASVVTVGGRRASVSVGFQLSKTKESLRKAAGTYSPREMRLGWGVLPARLRGESHRQRGETHRWKESERWEEVRRWNKSRVSRPSPRKKQLLAARRTQARMDRDFAEKQTAWEARVRQLVKDIKFITDQLEGMQL